MFDATATRAGPTRRTFLKAGAAVGGAFLLGFHLPSAMAANAETTVFAPNAFIRIDRQGKVTLIMPQVEMGQGIYTTVAMILAEELDAAFDQVVLEAAPPNDALYANPTFRIQVTGNSNSVRAFWLPLRKAGAAARALLVEASARIWQVDPATCRTDSGEVFHDASGRKASYAALVEHTAGLTAPADPPLKSTANFKLIGQSLKRLDTPDKVNGKVIYGIDAMPPGVTFATLAACPVFGGKVGHVDDSKAKSLPGVRQIVVLDDLVAVVGDHMWAARQGLEALKITWVEGPNAAVSSDDVWKQLRAASEKEGVTARSVGDATGALSKGELIEAAYELPFLAHATMEPMNCTVHLTADSCEIWVGSQVLSRAQAVAAKITGLPLEKITVHNLLIGGGFGRRLEVDHIDKAVRIAQQVAAPVKVVWTREEDIRHDVYRPVYRDRLSATLSGGRIVGWKHRITGSSIIARWLPPAFQKGIDIDAIDSAADIPYDIPNLSVDYVRDEPPAMPTGFWRGVGPNNNVFAIESFMDELARKAGKDPVAFRRDMLGKAPRLQAVLDLAAAKAGWGNPLPPRMGRGIALQTSFGSYIATVAEAEVDEAGEIRVRRIVSAVDTGIVVNPDTVVAQVQGGLIFGLTAALYGEITIDRGRVQQSNFHDYRMLRIDQTPAIEVHLIKSGEAPGGIGETGTTAAPPALGNAIFAATGVRLRRLPIDRSLLAGRKVG
ncbi:xanthine dehydrogenase family protein molybdopterin-binding subunit [Telmatospirillum siberiense]|uniref:Aldehyde dehydrogenase n=1 Tax=Telmatospirillum siberiense TaxID=382514 RepID=A0A2N3PXM4_9PROT|nr:xanthine dehydrogenase family protein molybdopterin-binding subunit [Telmatospirillum siberiense]PKU25162.1 aldehyde dehydrogenase [Telmatospirillum siberiense]